MKVLLPRQFYFSRADREGVGGRPRAGKRGPALHRAASAAPRAPRPVPATGPRDRTPQPQSGRPAARALSGPARQLRRPTRGGARVRRARGARRPRDPPVQPATPSRLEDPGPQSASWDPESGRSSGRSGTPGSRGAEEPRPGRALRGRRRRPSPRAAPHPPADPRPPARRRPRADSCVASALASLWGPATLPPLLYLSTLRCS